MTTVKTWRELAVLLGGRMRNHAYCEHHPRGKPEPDCPYCEDRAAFDVYAAKAGDADEPEEVEVFNPLDQSAWPAHLRDDAPVNRCSRCRRYTWSTEAFGTVCGMTQPNGRACNGRFEPAESPR